MSGKTAWTRELMQGQFAKDDVAKPDNTIVVSPGNRSRQVIKEAIRSELHATGALANDDREFHTPTQGSDMTGADREWAARYRPGNILRYTSGSEVGASSGTAMRWSALSIHAPTH